MCLKFCCFYYIIFSADRNKTNISGRGREDKAKENIYA